MPHGTRERARTRRPRRDIEERVRGDEDQRDDNESSSSESKGGGAISELRGVMSEAAVSVLSPVAKKLATQAAKMAVERGPELLEDTVMPKLQDLGDKAGGLGGGLGGLFGGGDDEEKGGGSGRAGDGTGKGRRMPIQQSVDVAAPIDVVYDQFTQFEDFPKFMHRVKKVEQRDEARVVFYEKIWGISRQWEAEIVEQTPDERIVWKTVSGMQHVGVVTFHELSERLTRLELNLDIEPEGPLEKIARGARFAKRAARADLHRFKAFVEMRDEETGAWRGAIEDGEVVEEDDYADEEDEGRDEPEAYEDEPEEDEEEERDEPEAYEDEDEEDEPEEDDEEDEARSKQAAAKSKGNGGRAKAKTSSSRSGSGSRSRSSASKSSGSARKPASGSGSGSRSRSSGSKSSGSTRSRAKASSSSSKRSR